MLRIYTFLYEVIRDGRTSFEYFEVTAEGAGDAGRAGVDYMLERYDILEIGRHELLACRPEGSKT